MRWPLLETDIYPLPTCLAPRARNFDRRPPTRPIIGLQRSRYTWLRDGASVALARLSGEKSGEMRHTLLIPLLQLSR